MHLQYLYSPPLLPQHLAIFAIWPSQSTTLYFYSDHHRGQVCRSGCPRRIPKEFRSKGCFKLLVSPCVVPRGFPLAVRGGSACPETKRCDRFSASFPPSPLPPSNEFLGRPAKHCLGTSNPQNARGIGRTRIDWDFGAMSMDLSSDGKIVCLSFEQWR